MISFPSTIPAIGTAKRGSEGYLSYLLRQANTVVRGAMDRRLAGFGLTFPQYTSLVMINAYPGLSNADLARVSMLTPQTINAVVHTLEQSGFIERTPHPTHRKIRCLTITPEGASRLTKAKSKTRDIEKLLGESLDEAMDKHIREWLADIAIRLSGDDAYIWVSDEARQSVISGSEPA